MIAWNVYDRQQADNPIRLPSLTHTDITMLFNSSRATDMMLWNVLQPNGQNQMSELFRLFLSKSNSLETYILILCMATKSLKINSISLDEIAFSICQFENES